MSRTRPKPLMVYLESVLFLLVQEEVLAHEPDLTASMYVRNLIFNDLNARQAITPEIMHSLVTHRPLARGARES